MKLDIGSGDRPYGNGYIAVDAYEPSAEVKAFMWELPYENNSVEAIYSSHSLEHISKHEVVKTLREWARVLTPGGEIIIRVPDLAWCCWHWLEHQTNDWWMDIIFGRQTGPGEEHKTGFTLSIMKDYLDQARLKLVSHGSLMSHDQSTLEFVCTKE